MEGGISYDAWVTGNCLSMVLSSATTSVPVGGINRQTMSVNLNGKSVLPAGPSESVNILQAKTSAGNVLTKKNFR